MSQVELKRERYDVRKCKRRLKVPNFELKKHETEPQLEMVDERRGFSRADSYMQISEFVSSFS